MKRLARTLLVLQAPWLQLAAAGQASAPGAAPVPVQAAPASGGPTAEPGDAAGPAPWGGSVAEGLARLNELEENGEREGALQLAQSLLATDFERGGMDPGEFERLQAELHYAAGVVWNRAEEVQSAVDANLAARALAGPGELRLDATYNAGVAYLEEGERQRKLVPEIANAAAANTGSGTPGATPLPPQALPGGAAGAAPEGPPPIELARAAYESARTQLVERLRADWRDVDTRANVELVQRRLRELDEIEKQREEQEQEEQEQSEDEQQDDSSESEDESESEESQDSEDQEDSESEQEEPSDEQQDSDPSDTQESEEESEEDPQQQDPSEAEQDEPEEGEPQPDDPQDPREEDEAQDAQAAEEQHLTREEAQRLLDRLAEIEESAEKLRALLRQKERVPVKRDW